MEAKPGRPKERHGTYQRITLEIRNDLLEYLDSRYASRRDTIERLLEKEKSQMSGFHPSEKTIDAWVDGMLNEATDDMSEKDMDITPETLSAFFEKEYQLPFTSEEARDWLSRQDWYQKKGYSE